MAEITTRLTTALADCYRIERHLGEGGMATVYLADPALRTRATNCRASSRSAIPVTVD